MTAVVALIALAQVLAALGLLAGLTARLLSPATTWPPVARWWRRRLVVVMSPVPGWRYA